MTLMNLLKISALIEIFAGIALILMPLVTSFLLFNSDLGLTASAFARVGGFGLLSFGIATWPILRVTPQSVLAILTYDILITIYFIYLGLGAELTGWLLWPVVLLHGILAVLIAAKFFKE